MANQWPALTSLPNGTIIFFMKRSFNKRFLDLDPPYSDHGSAHFVVLPVPYEATTTYGKGTKNGPDAILKASASLEPYDHELDNEPFKAGIHTLPPLKANIKDYRSKIAKSIGKILDDGKVPVMLGGEHSVTLPAVEACRKKYKNLSVLQFDAHADLKDELNGSKFNHGCVMRRVLEVCPAVQVGIRSLAIEERDFAKKTGQMSKIHFAEKVEIVDNVIAQLGKEVYVTFDFDALDPSIMPSTGTPEPGGLDYYEALDILSGVARSKKIVGIDFVELSPIKGLIHPDFTAARLIYKAIGYVSTLSGR